MFHEKAKATFYAAVDDVVSDISQYTNNPDKDFTRSRKLPPDKLITFLVSQGSSSTKNELLDFFELDAEAPTNSALNQQRAKLKPEGLEAVFKRFNRSIDSKESSPNYTLIATDGSSFSFFSTPSVSTEEYYVGNGHSAKGFYSMHLNAFYNLEEHLYTDAFIQPIHQKDEFKAFCAMISRYDASYNEKTIFIGDRGYCSYNNMAHVINKEQFFLFRTKDITSRGLVHNFDFPEEESFDISVVVTLVRTRSKEIQSVNGYKRFVDKKTSFDFIEFGSTDTYELSFRVVRFPLSNSSYECIVTNLPADEFPPQRIEELYSKRWGIESSFRKLKYTIGLSNFHTYKPEYVMQEIWAKLIAYNITEFLINHTVIYNEDTKHEYKVNFSVAAHICRVFLRPSTKGDSIDVLALLQRALIPIRNERKYPRLQTAHFRRPRYFIYRAA